MGQYVDKSALVAELERRIKTNKECMLGLRSLDYYQGKVDALNDTISFLDALEVKEVDLEKEIKHFTMSKELYEADSVIKAVAEHFFELGLQVNNKAQKGK